MADPRKPVDMEGQGWRSNERFDTETYANRVFAPVTAGRAGLEVAPFGGVCNSTAADRVPMVPNGVMTVNAGVPVSKVA